MLFRGPRKNAVTAYFRPRNSGWRQRRERESLETYMAATMQIVIIESNTFRQRQLKMLLTMLGNKASDVELTDSAAAGLSVLRAKRFDCCFLAVELSGQVKCVTVIEEIRSGLVLRSMPIIVLGEATTETVVAATKAGAQAFLTVPLSLENVESVFRQVRQQ
jgi:DNA-binding NtrC family response regulator